MSSLDVLLAEREIERLVYEYCRRVDEGEAGGIADLFTQDGEWVGLDLVLSGQDRIREWFTEREKLTRRVSRHLVTNLVIRLVSPDEAEATSYLLNFRTDRREETEQLPLAADLPKYVADFRDRFARTEAGWRFTRRQVDTTFIRPTTGRG